MTDCLICERHPTNPGTLTCAPCTTRISDTLTDIADLHTQLASPHPGPTTTYLANPTHRTGRYRYGLHLPAGVVPTRPPDTHHPHRVTGSAAPLDLTVLDLTAPARPGSWAPHARGVLGLDPDQTGVMPTATVLDRIATDWATQRREQRPTPIVGWLCAWLGDRLTWATTTQATIADTAAELRELRGILRAATGTSQRPEFVPGRCPRCRWRALYRLPGDDWIRCGNETACGRMMTPEEYQMIGVAV